MAQIYGELIRAQLQVAGDDLSTPVVGLVYFNTSTGLKWNDGTGVSGWKTAVELNSTQILTNKTLDATCSVDSSALSIVSLAKGGLGANVEGLVGVLKLASGATEVSLSAIVDADIDAAAAIDATKLADGSVDNTALQKLATVGTDAAGELVDTDSVQTLTNKTLGAGSSFDPSALPLTPPSKGGTGVVNNDLATLTRVGDHGLTLTTVDTTDVTLPVTGTLATLDGVELLTNKVISSTGLITGALKLPVGDESQRPSGQDGLIRFNSESNSFEGYSNGDWSGIGGGGTTDKITQVGHSLVVGDVLYLNGSTYEKALATAANTAEVVGVVSRVIDVDTFELTLSGEVTGLTGLTVGEVYFLSADTAGAITATEPSIIGNVSLPVGVASSATSLYVDIKRGVTVGGTNARTEVALTSDAVTNVQDVGGMDAGELTGWVFISSAAPVRFYLSAKFAKSGAGGDYNLSYQTSGDTPPAGFLVDITTTGMIRVTLPAASGSTSVINYALNAPAIGASFPLTVNADTILSGTVAAARLPSPTVYADAEATRMGLKSYLHGTAYNGGLSPTITLIGGGGVLLSVVKSNFIPYQMQDGGWRLKCDFVVNVSSATRTECRFEVNGITTKNIALYFQPIIGYQLSVTSSTVGYCYVNPNSSQFIINHSSTSTAYYSVGCDIELESKPTWAY